MATNGTGASGGSIYGELSLDDYSLDYVFQSCTKQTSEENLQPQIGQPAGTEGFLPIWTTNQGIQAAAQTQPWPHVQPAATGGFVPIWTTNQGIQAAAQTQPWPQQQVTDTNGFSPELWTKQGCQASAPTQSLTHGCPTAGDKEERRARKREIDRAYRQRKKEERQDLEDTVAEMGELRSEVESLKAEVRLLKEYVFGNQGLQPHPFNEMAQCMNKFGKSELKEIYFNDKVSTSREFEEWPASTDSQTPSSPELSAQVLKKVLPQAPRQSTILFRQKLKQRDRNAAPYNLGKTKKYPKGNN